MENNSSLSLPQNIVDTDYTMGPGRPTVMYNGGVTLNPHPAAIFGHEPVIPCCHLTFH